MRLTWLWEHALKGEPFENMLCCGPAIAVLKPKILGIFPDSVDHD